MSSHSRFQNASGAWITKGLFREVSYDRLDHVIFTLKPEPCSLPNGKVLDSFPQLYLSLCKTDPTEATLARLVFGGYEHWKILSETVALKEYIEALREENAIGIKSEAYDYLLKEVRTKGKNAYQSARYLLDKGVIPGKVKDSLTVRQAKVKNDDLNKQASSLISEDAERLGLKLVKE